MEGRCVVETWSEFGFSGPSDTLKVRFGFGEDVLVCTGSDEVYVYDSNQRKLKAVLQLPAPVSDLLESHDKQLLYVACSSGVYCVSAQFLQDRVKSSPVDASSSPAELKISSEAVVAEADGVSSLLLVDSVLLTLCQRDASWLLTLYRTPDQARPGSYEVLSSFSLPMVELGNTESKTEQRRRPVLICVHCGDASEAPSAHGHFRLESVLFKLLFGIEAALAKSPVLLCGFPDGRLCFLPLRVPGSQLRVLHSLEEPVMFIGASAAMETGPGHAQCLVGVGEQGRVVVIQTYKGGAEGKASAARFTEGCVPGPVACGCVGKKCLYYSTGSDLLALDLSDGSSGTECKESDEGISTKAAAVLQHPTSLNVCRVVALAEATCSAAGDSHLLALSARGQLQRIRLPVQRNNAELPKLPHNQVGRSVRDLLSAIGDVCERASALKTAIKSKSQILRHLNQVVNISFLLGASANAEGHLPVEEKPIRCRAVTSWSRLLQKDSLNLTCVLHNSSPYVLERGWTLSITVVPLSCSAAAGGESSCTNFSFPFCNLYPEETLEVSLPIAASGDTSFPMTVNCSLIFSLSSLLGEEAEEEEEEAVGFLCSQSSCISLPLNTLTVDWLHALQVNSLPANQKVIVSQSSGFTIDAIQDFLTSRRFRCNGRLTDTGGENASKPQTFSARVRLSSELLRETLVPKSSETDARPAPRNLCLSLLDWLLSDSPGGVKTGHHADGTALGGEAVHARGPNGATVKLAAKEINLGEGESIGAVEVQVESSSVAAVCGLHHAVLRRVQIQQSRISGAFSVGVSTGQVTQCLLGVYRELRENPLLIM
ncbi:Fanconi anemia core complex-associated protein 100 isoform X2 [Mugil cephalus]|uniref:Fanconi anemia core complex-associated protein 100 isoform X2 n=1 Tax=Mugil cephalus TaxID=48193 RepID=UPI001FB57835|nr:Fanconi anemia core complex-associated protein 100 isoform X2 [Mugil cephalus]